MDNSGGALNALTVLFLNAAPVELAFSDQHGGDDSRGERDGPAEEAQKRVRVGCGGSIVD